MIIEPSEGENKNFKICVILLLLIFIILKFFISPLMIEGESMEPTLDNKSFHLYLNSSIINLNIDKNDIVIFRKSSIEGKNIIKRVVAKEGDLVEIKDNKLFINSKEVKENYIAEPMKFANISVTVPKNCVFVLGDNRNNSLDSRYSLIGFVNLEEICGKLLF